jgi:hypothetical protein
MIEEKNFAQYIFADGKIISMTSNYSESSIELKLQIRKWVEKKIVPCFVTLRFENVDELDILEDFSTAGNYSDVVLVKITDEEFYASFDPFGNSGEPNESDNFVIKARKCIINEVQ